MYVSIFIHRALEYNCMSEHSHTRLRIRARIRTRIRACIRTFSHVQKEYIRILVEQEDFHGAARQLCRFGFTDDPEFKFLLRSRNLLSSGKADDGDGDFKDTQDGDGADVDVNSFWTPAPALLMLSSIVLVNDLTTLRALRERLLPKTVNAQQPPTVVGLDAEWRPFGSGDEPTPVSILQVSTLQETWILDLLVLEDRAAHARTLRREHREVMQELFCSTSLLKLGFGIQHDITRLVRTRDQPLYVCERV